MSKPKPVTAPKEEKEILSTFKQVKNNIFWSGFSNTIWKIGAVTTIAGFCLNAPLPNLITTLVVTAASLAIGSKLDKKIEATLDQIDATRPPALPQKAKSDGPKT